MEKKRGKRNGEKRREGKEEKEKERRRKIGENGKEAEG